MEKKKLITIGSIIIGVFAVAILIMYIVSVTKTTYITYEKFEERIVQAAKNYYENNPDELPLAENETILLYETLVTNNYIKPMNELLKDSNICESHVIVENVDGYFSYIPYLNCEDKYQTKTLYSQIIDNNGIKTEGIGLYQLNDVYYFRGEVKNNYVKFGEQLWLVQKLNSDGTITIIKPEKSDERYRWDDRYNINENHDHGVNEFEISRIKDTLIELEKSNLILTDEMKTKLTAKQLCIGKRKLIYDEVINDNSIECSTLSEDKYLLGLLTVSDYMMASIDINCKQFDSESCTNYNYISVLDASSWMLTAVEDNTYQVYYFSQNIDIKKASTKDTLILTANLSKNNYYKSGSGTQEDPYILK